MTSSCFRPPSLWGPREAGHNGQDGTPRTMAEAEDGTGSGCTSTWWSSDYKAQKKKKVSKGGCKFLHLDSREQKWWI